MYIFVSSLYVSVLLFTNADEHLSLVISLKNYICCLVEMHAHHCTFYQINYLNKRRMEEAVNLKEIQDKEEEARVLAKQEKEKYRAAKIEIDYVNQCTGREVSERKEAEARALRETREKEKLENALAGSVQQYQTFTWEEIVSATSSFSEDLRIGTGSYGTVYKGSLHHTSAAVKVLHSQEVHRTKEFLQEVWEFHK